MAYNNRDNRPSGRNNFGRRDFSRPSVYTRQGEDRQMFKVVCSECGKDCEVPFRPTGDRPVFCSSCFESKRGGSETRRFDDRNFNKPSYESKPVQPVQNNEQYNMINAKLDKILGLLTPSSVVVEKIEEPVVKVVKKRTSKKS